MVRTDGSSVTPEGFNEVLPANDDVPRLVAPKPIYAGANPLFQINSDQSNRTLESNRSGQDGVHQEDLLSRPAESTASLRAVADRNAVLPVQGEEEDAAAAIEKLERIERALQSKRRWLKGSGVEAFAVAATAGGKNAQRRKGDLLTEKANDSDSLFSLPMKEPGEVKLGISSLPGYNVIAAQRNRFRLGARRGTPDLVEDAGLKESQDLSDSASGTIRKSLNQRRGSLRPAKKEIADVPKMEDEEALKMVIQAQTDNAQDLPSSSDMTMTSRPLAANPDLTSVKEERAVEEAMEATKTAKPWKLIIDDLSPDHVSAHARPRLMVQSPSDNGLQAPPAVKTSLNALGTPFSSHIPSIISTRSDHGETCDDKAQIAAEECLGSVGRSSTPFLEGERLQGSPSTSSDDSDGEGSASDSENSDVQGSQQQDESFISLDHGNELTKKQKKKLLKRLRQHTPTERSDVADGRERTETAKRQHSRKGSLSNKMQVGLHYASSQSRNRRAMERYSPHPSRPSSTAPLSAVLADKREDSTSTLPEQLSANRRPSVSTVMHSGMPIFSDISRPSTPGMLNARDSGVNSRKSSMSEKDHDASTSILGHGNGDFCASPVADSIVDRDDRWAELARQVMRRQGTASSAKSMTGTSLSKRRRYFSLKRRKQNTSDVVEESDSDGKATPKEAAERDLDQVLGKLVAQQAPEELKEQYEYDVLYENQRGLMFFGIPKFSARTLFQWDPAPWTNVFNENSAYNVVTAQLPDPSWEWIHPEWMIDMSGDVDESGWQYSYNFGRFSLPLFTRPSQAIPRANSRGNEIMNKRMAKRLEAERTRADDGLEALKRSARARGAKWTGIPDQNKYVRRRRWIRLRGRKALPISAAAGATPNSNTPLAMSSRPSGDWLSLVREAMSKRDQVKAAKKDDDSSSEDDNDLSDLESDETDSLVDYAAAGEGSSAFLPQRTAGVLRNGRDPAERKSDREQERRRKHAKEFTGTIRELKSLLPAIMDRRYHQRRLDKQQAQKNMWLTEIDARNPFISWNLVKKRLEDDDMAFASASLRARERRYAQRALERREKAERRNTADTQSEITPIWQRDQTFELTRDATVEINYRRVMRVMRACKVDRQKLQLWKIWLGVEPVSSITEVARDEDLVNAGLGINSTTATESLIQERKNALRHARGKWKKAFSQPDVIDVWDVLERRLDQLLLTFEFQGSRASLLRLLLTVHAQTHANHRFKRTHWTMDTQDQQVIEPNVPSAISPRSAAQPVFNLDERSATAAGEEWCAVNLPRLEFWSDLEKCAKALLDGERTAESTRLSPNHPSPRLASPSPSLARSSTPQPLTGSLANGRRYSQPSFASPGTSSLRPISTPPASILASPPPAFSRLPIEGAGRDGDGEQSFLASLLQLPTENQKELLVKAGEQQDYERGHNTTTPSRLIRRLTEAAEEDEQQED